MERQDGSAESVFTLSEEIAHGLAIGLFCSQPAQSARAVGCFEFETESDFVVDCVAAWNGNVHGLSKYFIRRGDGKSGILEFTSCAIGDLLILHAFNRDAIDVKERCINVLLMNSHVMRRPTSERFGIKTYVPGKFKMVCRYILDVTISAGIYGIAHARCKSNRDTH